VIFDKKKMKYPKYLSILLMCCLIFSSCSTAKKTSKDNVQDTSYSEMVDSQHFIFIAQTVNPLRGRFRTLTSSYDVTVSKDSLRSYLPYFGRSYNPQLPETTSPLDFTSTDFSYSVSPYKKNAWNITIKPRDKPSIQQYFFTIYNNGSATLNVTSTSSDAISFNGRIEEKK